MKQRSGYVVGLFVIMFLCLNSSGAEDIYAPPSLEKGVPAALDIPADFKPAGKMPGARLGLRRTSAIVLEEQQGVHPIYITEIPERVLAGDPLKAGDILIAVNGKPLGKNPDGQFRDAFTEASKHTGVMWVTRWRPIDKAQGGKGAIESVMLDLGTHPLDLTKTGTPGGTLDWRLGPLGANGWAFSRTTANGASSKARQIIMTAVDKGGPCEGKLSVGDVILGVNNEKFASDARKALAAAINEAEKEKNKGKLKLLVWSPPSRESSGAASTAGEGPSTDSTSSPQAGLRAGKEVEVVVTIPVLGSYSTTAPYDCAKTDKIIDNAVEYMKKNKESLLKPDVWLSYINGLGLMATGREDVMPLLKELAHSSMLAQGETLSIEKHVGMMCWSWSYKTLFMCEYYLRTKDEAVLPTIEEYATKIAMGQSGAGTWGHTYAAIENAGVMHGPLGGYGAINQQGLTLMIVLPLAEKCGIKNKEVQDAIKRGNNFFSYFIGKGTIPYGDHGAANEWFDDNGKSGSAAIFFDLMNNREGTKFFSEMILASAPSGREAGHTGHFWSHLWGGIGAARGGEKSLQVFMDVMGPIFTLERQPDGRFVFQGNVGENDEKGDPKTKWDCTGARLLQLCVPRRILYVTGKDTPKETHLTQQRIEEILSAGRLDVDRDARDNLSVDQILQLLQDPLPPTRSIGAQTLAERELNIVDKLIPLLDSDNRHARYGAAEALCKAGFANKAAADKLIELMATDKDGTFRSYAIDALINRDEEKGLLTVAKPAIPVLLKMAVERSPDDPRRVLQQRVSLALFYNGNAQPRRGLLFKYGLEGVDRELLIPAIKEILTNQNGGTRSLTGWVYPKLTADEIYKMWPDLYKASRYVAPSGAMFAAGVREAGMQAMADHHISEGLDLAAWHVRHCSGHSSVKIKDSLAAIEKYGAHAKRILPQLEEHYVYWVEKDGSKKNAESPSTLIRKTIDKIKAMPDKADFELVSIADKIKDIKDPYLSEAVGR